jgi:hypothetical protein
VADRGPAGAEVEDAGQPSGVEAVVAVALQDAVRDREGAGPVVADEEDRPAALGGVVAGEPLLSAPPLLQTLSANRLAMTATGRPRYWESARTAPPPTSGPSGSQRLATKVECSMRNRPPRTKIAPPPPPSKSSPVELPCVNVRFATVSRGVAWSWQCEVVNR